jgi:hypothetical protein
MLAPVIPLITGKPDLIIPVPYEQPAGILKDFFQL